MGIGDSAFVKGSNVACGVSHNSTIMAFTGLTLAEGETVVLEPDPADSRGLRVVGRIPLPR